MIWQPGMKNYTNQMSQYVKSRSTWTWINLLHELRGRSQIWIISHSFTSSLLWQWKASATINQPLPAHARNSWSKCIISVSSSHVITWGNEFNPGMNEQAFDLNDSITTKPVVEVTNPDGSTVPQVKPIATETSIDYFKVETSPLIKSQQQVARQRHCFNPKGGPETYTYAIITA